MTSNSVHNTAGSGIDHYYPGSDVGRSAKEELYQNHQQIYGKQTLHPRSEGMELLDDCANGSGTSSTDNTPPPVDSPVVSSQESDPSRGSSNEILTETSKKIDTDTENELYSGAMETLTSVTTPSTLNSNSSTPTNNTNEIYKKLTIIDETPERAINDDVTKIEDPEINYFLSELDQLIDHLKEMGDDKKGKELIDIVTKTKSKLLRLNLNKNLIKFQLKNKEEDYQTEIQLLLKNISSFERSLQVLRNENEIINIKNLKLIKYCKSLKNDKIKSLKKENSHLKRQLEKYSIVLSPIADTHSALFQSQPSTASSNQQEQQQQQQQKQAENGKRKRLSSSSSSSSSSTNEREPYKGPLSPNGPGSNMLDTLGRLASHVLEDGEFRPKK